MEQNSKGQDRLMTTTAGQWSQWSDANLHELLCVPGKYFGMGCENTACAEQPLTLLVAMRAH